jgi:HPt (histidine-containing phosphotransfer) domain-containing protein
MSKSNAPIFSDLASDPDYADLVQDFVLEIPRKCTEIQQVVSADDQLGLQRIIHQLRGACGGYGFPTLTHAAGAIEDQLANGVSIAAIRLQLDDFTEMLQRASAMPSE